MTNYSQIMEEINKIISFCMVKGVQPHELISAIFEDEYKHIETYKKVSIYILYCLIQTLMKMVSTILK